LGFNDDEVVLGEDITSIVVAMKRKEDKSKVCFGYVLLDMF
jgi:hypothetical protein